MALPLPRYACCILLRARDAHVLLEARGPCAAIAPNSLTCFGGKVEACDASAEVAVLRELMEELRWRPGAPLRFAVDLYVGGALTARFFAAEAPSEPEMLAVVQQEPGRGHAWLPLAAASSADSRVSPWHRSVLEAFSRGAARADVAAPPFGGAPVPRPFGFWRSGADPSLPHPVPSAPPPPADAAVLLRYLTAHALVESYEHGHSTCRLCGERSRALGCATLTDGAWLWPEGFAHYFTAHGVQPPREVLDAALRAHAAAGGAELPPRNHMLWQPSGGPPEALPRGTAAWLREHSTLALPPP